MITYKKGNILTAFKDREIDDIVHGVNCRGGFGSGLAGQIAEEYPDVRKAYLKVHNNEGHVLGSVTGFYVLENGIIYNEATQDNFGYDGEKYVSYDAIESCLKELKKKQEWTGRSLGIPRIGCGLAGGSWNVVKAIIEDVFKDSEVKVTVYEYQA